MINFVTRELVSRYNGMKYYEESDRGQTITIKKTPTKSMNSRQKTH